MDILNEFRKWIMVHWSSLEAEGLRIELQGQMEQQTVKTNHLDLYTSNNRYEARVTIWEFGNCDATIADMEAHISVPMDKAIKVHFFEEIGSPETLNAAMETILNYFRTTINTT